MSARAACAVVSLVLVLVSTSGCRKKTSDATPAPSTSASALVEIGDAAASADASSTRTGRSSSRLVGLSRDRTKALVFEPDHLQRAGSYRLFDIASKRVLGQWSLVALEGNQFGLGGPPQSYFSEKLVHPKLADDVFKQGIALDDIVAARPGPYGDVARSADGQRFIVDIGNGFHLAEANGTVRRPWGEPRWRGLDRSPDGRLVAFLEDKRVMVSPIADYPVPRAIVTADDAKLNDFAAWSPDASALFVVTEKCVERVDMRSPTAQPVKVVCVPPTTGSWSHVFSPDRRWVGIVFERGRGDLFLIVDTTSKRPPVEVPAPFGRTRPLGVSDEGVLVLNSWDDGPDLFVVRADKLDGGRRMPAKHASGVIRAAWLSPKTLVYPWHDTLETIDVVP